MKILVALGTRPEVIKLAPVIAALRERAQTVVCSTGQHREMLDQALSSFAICPDHRLDVMSPGLSLNVLASRLLGDVDRVLDEERPDWIVVQGDTTTAFCVGLAGFHRGIPIAHVEAGLRTRNLNSPFPEEANRSLLAKIARLHFAPTQLARQNLLADGVEPESVVVTGNTVVDAIDQVRQKWGRGWPETLPETLNLAPDQRSVLVTCHRRENFGAVLEGFCAMLREQCRRYADYRWIFPVHLNPGVRAPVMRLLGNITNLSLIDPVDYDTSLYLISRSALVVSDSGGIQEESPSFGVPIVVMRTHTERQEGVSAGFASLAGQDPGHVASAIQGWLDHPERMHALRGRPNPYGDGQAARRIAACLLGESFAEFQE
jgi:UDP-N-acetylglucosamine 2-epimerase (non-hydrolysing)